MVFIQRGDGDNNIDGTSGNDEIFAGGGDDSVQGFAGNDQIFGEAGDDILGGGDGNDTIRGGEGNDIVLGKDKADNLGGGAGNDSIEGGNGSDTLFGGQGDDYLFGGAGADRFASGINGNPGFNDGGKDEWTGGEGSDLFIISHGFNDGIAGTSGNHVIIEDWSSLDTIDRGGLTNLYVREMDSGTWVLQDNTSGDDDDLIAIVQAPCSSVAAHLGLADCNEPPERISPIGSQTAAEDSFFSLNVSNNFNDPDSDPITYTITGLPSSLNINQQTGVISGTPTNSEANRSYNVVVIARTPDGEFATDNFSLTVQNVNDSPIFNGFIPNQVATEDISFSLNTASFFSDEDTIHGDGLTFSATGLPSSLNINQQTGVISGIITNDEADTFYPIQVIATDNSNAAISSNSFTLNAVNVNDAPELITPISDSVATEDEAFSLDVSSDFSDDDLIHGDSLTYSATGLPSELSISPSTGIITGTPTNNTVGDYDITITATDTENTSVSDTFNLVVENVNDIPELITPITDQVATEDEAFSLDVTNNFSDDDLIHGDSLTYSATGLPSELSISPSTGIITGTPTNNTVGDYNITITATDTENSSISDTFNLVVENVNDIPELITPISDSVATEDEVFSLDVTNNFSDDDLIHGDSLTYSATGLPSELSISPSTGIITGTPTNNTVGNYDITITATDTENTSVSDTFNLVVGNVNDIPELITPISDSVATEDEVFSLDVTNNFSDDDLIHGDSLTYSATGLPSELTISPSTGIITGTPTNNTVGDYDITITATDTENTSVSDTFNLVVENSQLPVPEVEVSLELLELDNIPGIVIGEEFLIDVRFHDLVNNQSIFSGFTDIEFDNNILEVNEIIYSPNYNFSQTGTINNLNGIVDEVGATDGFIPPSDDVIFSLNVTAIGGGNTEIVSNAGESFLSQILPFGAIEDVRDTTLFGNLDLNVNGIEIKIDFTDTGLSQRP